MNTVDNEIIREALINLDRSREKERVLREQANSLLRGLEIITSATGTDDMLGRLLSMVTEQLQCDDAIILSSLEIEEGGEQLHCIGATTPLYIESRWPRDKVIERVLQGHPVMLYSVARSTEWQQQPQQIRDQSGSALLISFPVVDQVMVLCCISRAQAYFKKQHMSLLQRLIPIASHALQTLSINEQLQQEIDERNRLEQYASFQAGIAEMSASVLHNIGNTITGAQGYLLKLGHQRKNLFGLVKVFDTVLQWMQQDEVSPEQINKVRQVLEGAGKLLTELSGERGTFQEGLDAMERSTHHVAEIIQMQRGVSRPVLSASRFDARQMIGDTLSMIQESIDRRGVSVEVELDSAIRSLWLPRNPMIQMLLNLVKNSMESIDERLQDEPALQGVIRVSMALAGEGEVELVVADNGVGIAAERSKEIFKFGESSKERGSGFGLHSVANFVKGVGGEVFVESEGPNRGARMVVRLPMVMEGMEESVTDDTGAE